MLCNCKHEGSIMSFCSRESKALQLWKAVQLFVDPLETLGVVSSILVSALILNTGIPALAPKNCSKLNCHKEGSAELPSIQGKHQSWKKALNKSRGLWYFSWDQPGSHSLLYCFLILCFFSLQLGGFFHPSFWRKTIRSTPRQRIYSAVDKCWSFITICMCFVSTAIPLTNTDFTHRPWLILHLPSGNNQHHWNGWTKKDSKD